MTEHLDECMYGSIGYAVCDDNCKCKCGKHTKWSEIFGKSEVKA